jgi:thiol-disulfide isomerase/thioredoxin
MIKPLFKIALGAVVLTSILQAPVLAESLGEAPKFSLKSVKDNKSVNLADFKGKVLIINFWATWCPPCRSEIPDFIKLQKEYGSKGLQIIGLAVDAGGAKVVSDFGKEMGINYVSLLADAQTQQAYGGIRGIPATFIVDRKGQIVKKYLGAKSKEQFEAEIKPLL